MAQKTVYLTHLYPQNATGGNASERPTRTYSFEIGRSANRGWQGPGLDSQMYGNLVQTDDPANPVWVFRKAIMVPTQTFTSVEAVRAWNQGHQTGGGVGYQSGNATSQLAMDICSPQTTHQLSNGSVGAWDSDGVVHTKRYFERFLCGGGNYDPVIDWYRNTTKVHRQYEFDFDTWYFFEVVTRIRSDGTGFWTEKVNGVTWINNYVGPLHLPGVSTQYYPNNAGLTGFETIEGAYIAASQPSLQQEFLVYHTMEQAGSGATEAIARAACIADNPTISLGDHSRAIPGGAYPDSFSQSTGTTIDDAGFGLSGTPPPTNTSPPTLGTSTPVVGVAVTESDGTWTGSPTFARQWQTSADGGNTPVNISGATGTTYTPTSDTSGKKLRLQVTGTNAGGSATAASSWSSSIAAAAGGAVTLGHTPASAQAQALALSANFKRGSIFTLAADATLVDLRATVQGSGSAGTQAIRLGIASVVAGVPTSIVAVTGDTTINGTDAKRDIVDTSAGSLAFVAGDYLPFMHSGAPSGAQLVAQGFFDAGVGQLRFEADTFSDGTAAFASPGTGDGVAAVWATLTAAAPSGSPGPTNSVAPTLSGSFVSGLTVNCDPGTWGNTPAFTYQWKQGGGSNIANATSQSYVVAETDVGHTLQCTVTGTNTSGSLAVATTASASVVTGIAANTTAPSIFGAAYSPSTLGAFVGAWSNSPTEYLYQWQRDNHGNSVYADISGQTTANYAVQESDIGCRIRVKVAALTPAGTSAYTNSASVGPIVLAPDVVLNASFVTTTKAARSDIDGVAWISPNIVSRFVDPDFLRMRTMINTAFDLLNAGSDRSVTCTVNYTSGSFVYFNLTT